MTLTQITEKGIKDGEIINADINASAAIAKSKLASLDIVNADVNASAAIAKSKLASLDIVNADVNASAAIAGSKVAPDFGSQNIITTGYVEVGNNGSRFAENNLKFDSAGAAYIDQTVTGQDINFRVSKF